MVRDLYRPAVRFDQPAPVACAVYEPCVALIVQGSKRLVLGEQAVRYGEDRLLVVTMDLPVKSVVMEASPSRPYLVVGLRLD